MSSALRYFYCLLVSLILESNYATDMREDVVEESLRVRVRRQDGYVYDKPSVTLDLPSRPTTQLNQAPTVDRTLTQHMFYAYPVPASDTINIGNTVSTTTTPGTTAKPTPSGAAGYNYRSSTTANAGYSYGTPAPTAEQENISSQVTNTASQTAVTSSQTTTGSGSSQVASGYGYNAPSSTLTPTLQNSPDVSTNAPKYLPPVTSGGTASTSGGSVSVAGVSVTGSNTQTGSTSLGTPSDNYLPPVSVTNTVSTGTIVVSTPRDIQSNQGGSVSIPSTAYLPPKSSPIQGSSSTSQPIPSGNYLPPINVESNTGTVSSSVPALGYLPQGFF